jgi:uncharacterized protein YfaP (DUF2135 family)
MKKRTNILFVIFILLLTSIFITSCSKKKTTEPKVVKTPVILPAGGEFQAPQQVTITCETEDAIIYYTIDGSEPTENSSLYNGVITLVADVILKAKAFKTGWTASNIATAQFTIQIQAGMIYINSTPPGASIYFNGTNMNMITPNVLMNVPTGNHHVRLFKVGFNEYQEYFDFNETANYTIHAILTESGFPLPIITINSPQNLQHFNDNVINVNGTIHLVDSGGNQSVFEGNNAILTLNETDIIIPVNSGYFSVNISIYSGENSLQIRANSSEGNTGLSDLIIVYGDFTEPDITITLTWNTPTADLDLHIWNPQGQHCYYANMNIAEGSLDIDETEGYGPETFTALNAVDGTYLVKVNCYSLDNDDYTDANIQLNLLGVNTVYGPHRFTIEDFNGNDPNAWWDVIEFTVVSGKISSDVKPISAAMRQKIIADMKNLKKK